MQARASLTRPRNHRMLPWAIVLAAALQAHALPMVNAGDDMLSIPLSTAVGGNIYLTGAVTDNGTPSDSTVWTSVPPTPGVAFGDRLSTSTRATLPDTGSYLLELRAFYGAQSYADTIRITVRPNLPFVVLLPREMEQVQTGKPFVIRWQMDPSKRCTVELSVNDGLTFTWLNLTAPVKDSLVWDVDADYADNTLALVKIHEYQVFDPVATRTFVLVNHAPQAYQSVHQQPRRNVVEALGGSVRLDRNGVARIGKAVSGAISVFDARGRLVMQSPVRNGIASGAVTTRGVLTLRYSDEGKSGWRRLVSVQ